MCGVIQDGVAAVFGPRAPATTGIVQSVCETLEVPNLQIYPEVPQYPGRCLINLHPAQESMAQVRDAQTDAESAPGRTTHSLSVPQAIVDVVRNFLHWSVFTVLYETDEGLLRLQEVLKARGPSDPRITVRQFLPGSDQRYVNVSRCVLQLCVSPHAPHDAVLFAGNCSRRSTPPESPTSCWTAPRTAFWTSCARHARSR